MTVTLHARGEELRGKHVRLCEYEPLDIVVVQNADSQVQPAVAIDGSPLGAPTVTIVPGGLRWSWVFRSESWCGRSKLRIDTERGRFDVDIDVEPSGSKYSADEYEQMIERVLAHGAQLGWGLAPGEAAAAEAEGNGLGATHPVLIATYLAPLLDQLRRILRDPVVSQRRVSLIEPLRPHRPRTPNTLVWLASRPARLAALRRGDERVALPQHVRLEAYDHPANRYVLSLANRLRASFVRTSTALRHFSGKQLLGDLEKQKAIYLAGQALEASHWLGRALRHPVLEDLAPGEMTEGASQVFADHPAYARFARLARRLLNPALAMSRKGDLAASMRRSWDLFEIYSLFRMIESLEEALGNGWRFERQGLRGHVLTGPPEGLCWRGVGPNGLRLDLRYQQTFGRASRGPASLTTQRKPDFVLAMFRGDLLAEWLLLDAKYRTAKASINEAMESMHVYRDSLLWRCPATDKRRKAAAGYLLVPAVADDCLRYAAPELLDQWDVGLLPIDEAGLGTRLAVRIGARPAP